MVIHQTQPYSCFYTSWRITINPYKTIKTKYYTQHIVLANQTIYKPGRTYNYCPKISHDNKIVIIINNNNNNNNNKNKMKQ